MKAEYEKWTLQSSEQDLGTFSSNICTQACLSNYAVHMLKVETYFFLDPSQQNLK